MTIWTENIEYKPWAPSSAFCVEPLPGFSLKFIGSALAKCASVFNSAPVRVVISDIVTAWR